MTHPSVHVQIAPTAVPPTPWWLGDVAVVAQVFSQLGLQKAIEERVPTARARMGDDEVIDFVVMLIGYAVSGERTRQSLSHRLLPFAEPFMALCGRANLPHPATRSRFLAALDQAPADRKIWKPCSPMKIRNTIPIAGCLRCPVGKRSGKSSRNENLDRQTRPLTTYRTCCFLCCFFLSPGISPPLERLQERILTIRCVHWRRASRPRNGYVPVFSWVGSRFPWVWKLRLEFGPHVSASPMRLTALASSQRDEPVQASEPLKASELVKADESVSSGPAQWARRSFTKGFAGADVALQPDGTLRCPADHPRYPQERRGKRDGSVRLLSAARIGPSRSLLSSPRPVSRKQLHQQTATGERGVLATDFHHVPTR